MLLIAWDYFTSKRNLQLPCAKNVNYEETLVSVKKRMKTKENGRNIYKMVNAWLRNCRSILAFRRNKGYKERGRKDNAWRAVFNSIFINNNGPSHTLKSCPFFLLLSLKSWHASPALNYGKLLVLFFLKIFPASTTFSFFFWFAPDDSLRGNRKTLTAPIS